MGYIYEGKYGAKGMKKEFVPSLQYTSYCVVPQQGKIFWQRLHPSYPWLTVWLLICSWTCRNQSSASRAGGKTTVGPLNDPDSPIYSSKTPQEILSEVKTEINVHKTLAWKCKSLLSQVATIIFSSLQTHEAPLQKYGSTLIVEKLLQVITFWWLQNFS